MNNRTNRRTFLKTTTLMGSALLLRNELLLPGGSAGSKLAVVKGEDTFAATLKVIEKLGGISRFVSSGKSVGLLINAPSWWQKPGSFTNPEIVLALIDMCFKAGVNDIQYLINPADNYWNRTPLSKKYQNIINRVKKCSGNYVQKKVPKGIALKKVKIIRELLECDYFINIPIIKHHKGTHMSGCLKNYMGANDHKTNQFFHSGSGAKSSYADINFLSQCIADLNTLRKPDICLVDATEFLLNNGPGGPGKLKKLNTVVAGNDPVSLDAYGSTLLNRSPQEILMLGMAGKHGIGRIKGKII